MKSLNKSFLGLFVFLILGWMSTSSLSAWDLSPDSNRCLHGNLYVDFIYWQIHPEGLEFARQDGIAANATTSLDKNGGIFETGCAYDPGVRAGLIVPLGCCNWDFFGQYTYLHEQFGHYGSVLYGSTGLEPLLFTDFTYEGTFSDINLANGHFENRLNVLDVGLGRTFEADNCFEFRLDLGIKATWQHLKYTVNYQKILDPRPASYTYMNYLAKFNTDFDGVGLRGGCETSWRFTPCFRLMGSWHLSTLWSDLSTTRKDHFGLIVLDEEVESQNTINLKERHCVLLPVLELLLGFRWDDCLCNRYPIYVFIGWENQVWFGNNHFLYISSPSNTNDNGIEFGSHGNITYQGLVVRAGIGF